MEMIGTNVSANQEKNKKIMKIILILIIILCVSCFAIMGVIYYLQKTQFKFIINGNEISKYSEDLFIFEENEMYISIKDMAPFLQYIAYNGSYGSQEQYSEDTTKCYVEGEDEVASFEINSNKIYKSEINKSNDYQYIEIEKPVKQINNKLYTTIEGISRAYNVVLGYDKKTNQVNIYTLTNLVEGYSKNIRNLSVENSFSNQKAILYNFLVVSSLSSNGERYGIISINGTEIVGTKYSNIEFIESTEEFLVTTSEGKMGIITGSGKTKVQPKYDELKQIDKDSNLYLATLNNKKGIIEQNGKILIYLEYDKIGINTDDFKSSSIKNPYILYDNCIPVSQNEKWGMYDKTGKLILPIEYDAFGCTEKIQNINANNVLVIPEIKGIVVEKKIRRNKLLWNCKLFG